MRLPATKQNTGRLIHVACDLCGADDTRLVFYAVDTNYHFEGTFHIVRCERCGLVYLNPRPDAETIGLYYPNAEYFCYDQVTDEPAGLGPAHPFSQAVKRAGIRPGRLCDVGCGTGTFLAAAQHTGWKVAGVEPNEHARHQCNTRLGDEVVFPSLETARFRAKSFDAVTLWHVLEHMPSPLQALREVHRILRIGGVVVVAVPNFDSLERRLWRGNWIDVDAPRHFYHFTPATLVRYMASEGFDTMSLYQEPSAESLAASLLRTLRCLVLDSLVRVDSRSSVPVSARTAEAERVPVQGYYKVSDKTKVRSLRIVTRLAHPLAWAIANLKLGPALILEGHKTGKQREPLSSFDERNTNVPEPGVLELVAGRGQGGMERGMQGERGTG